MARTMSRGAFATSVGSVAVSIKLAILLAAVCEFTGALFMGSHVTEAIRKGIADYKCFQNDPALMMYGCLCVLAATSIWLILASYLEMPVSTTHSCVGGMIGMTLATRGQKCVIWSKKVDEFPYVKVFLRLSFRGCFLRLFPASSRLPCSFL